MVTPDPKLDLRDFLRSAVDGTAISVPFTPADDIVVANYDVGPDWPEVAVVSADWVTFGGGQTGATAMDPTGAGAYQEGYYSVLVDCWGGPRDASTYATNGSDPDTVAEELGQEVARATRAGEGGVSGYEFTYSEPPRDANATDANPTEYRRQVTVRLAYRYDP
jgi:hypothetical protein